jgi:transposase-like protein
VTSKAKRRSFPAEYKRKILQEADACTEPGQVGALLRREGLYSSHLVTWRRARESGELAGLEAKKRGPKAKEVNPLAKELADKDVRTRGCGPRTRSCSSSATSKKKSRSSWG